MRKKYIIAFITKKYISPMGFTKTLKECKKLLKIHGKNYKIYKLEEVND